MPKTKQPGKERQQRTLDRMSRDNAGTEVDRMEGNITSEQADQKIKARQKVALGQGGSTSSTDLFPSGNPTGLPLGQDPSNVREMGEEEVSPEEQAQYDQIVRAAATLIYKNPKQTVESMNFRDLPVHQAVGRTAAKIGEAVEASAAAAGQKLDPDTLWHAGSEVIEMLMDLGTQTKVFTLDPESEQYQQEAAMALMEAEKILGEKALRDPKKASQLSAEASDAWAWNIAKEVDGGQASPQYMQMVDQYRQANDPITGGVRRALGGNNGT